MKKSLLLLLAAVLFFAGIYFWQLSNQNKVDKSDMSSQSESLPETEGISSSLESSSEPPPSSSQPEAESEPEPPAPPEIPEDQKNNPNSKPEYKPEQLEPNKPAANTPSDGDRKVDADGQEWIFVEGFGWHKPTGGVVIPGGDNTGWEDSEKIGY